MDHKLRQGTILLYFDYGQGGDSIYGRHLRLAEEGSDLVLNVDLHPVSGFQQFDTESLFQEARPLRAIEVHDETTIKRFSDFARNHRHQYAGLQLALAYKGRTMRRAVQLEQPDQHRLRLVVC